MEYALASVPGKEYGEFMPHLLIQNGNGEPRQYALNGDHVTIGRLSDNNVILEDETVSGHHAEILAVTGAYTLRDVGSSNGTKVNGTPTIEATIKDGDMISFGSVECRFHDQPEVDEPKSPLPESTPIVELGTNVPEEPHPSLASQLAGFGKAALGEAKRNVKMASLKAHIEKLRLVDLNRAHYALGRKAYELKVQPKNFHSVYEEIASVEAAIAAKRRGAQSTDSATAIEKFKTAAVSTKLKAEAEAMELKLQKRFIALGQGIQQSGNAPEIESEFERLRSLLSKLTGMENECSTASADHSSQAELQRLSASLVKQTGATAAATIARNLNAFKRRFPHKLAVPVAVLLLLALIGLCAILPRMLPKRWTSKGQVALGDMYAEGKEVPLDMAKAVEWYRKAAEAGNADAQVKLASVYLLGWFGAQPDDDLAKQWYQKAADQGNPLGQHYLGWMYREGRGMAKNDAEAFRWCSKAAKQGYADSQCLLGLMYFDGSGVGQDYALSAKWHRSAAEQGNTTSQTVLGGMLLTGRGIPQNKAEGVKWMQKAVDGGDANAQTDLGIMYYNGNYVEQDKSKGVALVEQAARQGNKKAQAEVDRLNNSSQGLSTVRTLSRPSTSSTSNDSASYESEEARKLRGWRPYSIQEIKDQAAARGLPMSDEEANRIQYEGEFCARWLMQQMGPKKFRDMYGDSPEPPSR